MTISSIGSNSYYMGQMSGMGGRSPGRMSKSAGEAPPTPEEMFDKLDADGSGGLDQTEFQTLADKVSQSSETDSESLFAAYDADEDGILSQEETLTFMEENRPSGPPPGGMAGGMGGMGGPPPDASEIFSELDEDEDGSLNETEFQTLADKIGETTGEDVDAEALFAEYDTDGDGVVSEAEATAAIEKNQPEGPPPPPPGGMMSESENGQQGMPPGIESYIRMDAMGMGRNQGGDMSAMFGGNSDMSSSGMQFPFNIMA